MATTIVLVHGDLDGMTSGILLLKGLEADTGIKITNGKRLASTLIELANHDQSIQSIYIADIPLIEEQVAAVEMALRNLHRREIKIHLFDHHIGWELSGTHLIQYFETNIIDSKKTTAAALVWKYFLRRDPAASRWLGMLSQKDKSIDESIRRDFILLQSLMQPENWPKTSLVLTALARDLPIDKERETLTSYQAKHVMKEKEIANNAIIFETLKSRRIGKVDLRGQDGYFYISKLIIELHSVDLALTITNKKIILSSDSIDRGIDLSSLHGYHERCGMRFSIAGHKNPVSIQPITGAINEEFIDIICNFIKEKL